MALQFWMVILSMVLQMLPYFFMAPLIVLYFQEQVCYKLQGGQSCDSSSVSSQAALWSTLCTTCTYGLSIVAVASFGPRSDASGRRILLVLPAVGNLICYVMVALASTWRLSLWFVFLAYFISGIMGSHYLFSTGIFASVSDITDNDHLRTSRFSIAEGSQYVAVALASTCSGIILEQVGFTSCFLLAVVVQSLSLACQLCLPESLPPDSLQSTPMCPRLCSLFSPMRFLSRSVGHAAIALVVAILTLTVPLSSSVSVLFVRHVYDWSETTTGYFVALGHGLKGIGCAVLLPRLKACGPGQDVSDKMLLIVSLLFTAVVLGLTGAVREPGVLWLAQCLWLFAGISVPLARSTFSKRCGDYEQGNALALVCMVEGCFGLLGHPLVQSGIYSTTVSAGCPGCAFLAVSALLVCLACVLALVKLSPLELLTKQKLGYASKATASLSEPLRFTASLSEPLRSIL